MINKRLLKSIERHQLTKLITDEPTHKDKKPRFFCFISPPFTRNTHNTFITLLNGMCDTHGAISLRGAFFTILRNQMEDRILKTKLGSLELAEKRLLKRYRSETRLLKIKQEQRLGNLAIKRNEANGTNSNKRSPSPQSMVCIDNVLYSSFNSRSP